MKSQTKRLLAVLSVSASVFMLIFLVNQIVQLSGAIARLNSLAGTVFLVAALIILSVSLLIPALLFFRMPRSLIPPEHAAGEEYEKHLRLLGGRLSQNPYVSSGRRLQTAGELQSALDQLNLVSRAVVEKTGKKAFFTTAISQNGALDALFIIALQFKLIWDVAHIYNQRPSLRDLSFLYSNVFATALIATQLDEAEYLQMVESAVNTGIGSAISFVPGTSMIVNSALSGASNAFLTLRIGAITQKYCGSLVRPERSSIRNSATGSAAKMLGKIVSKGTYDLIKFMSAAPFKKAYKSTSDVGVRMRNFRSSVFGTRSKSPADESDVSKGEK